MNARDMRDTLNSMSYENIIEFEALLKSHKKSFKPFRIKTKFKRCGKKDCTCMTGPSNNEWGNLHGPFLSVQYQDKHSGKTKVLGLGREYTSDEIYKLGQSDRPQWYHYSVSTFLYDKMSFDVQREIASRTLTDNDFNDHYGVNINDDMQGHPKKIMYDITKFNNALDEYHKRANIWRSRWADFGIGTTSGINVLDGLIDDGYYLKE